MRTLENEPTKAPDSVSVSVTIQNGELLILRASGTLEEVLKAIEGILRREWVTPPQDLRGKETLPRIPGIPTGL